MSSWADVGNATLTACSPLVEGAWEGRLVHLAGLDVIGSTAGSLARFTQDREVELWEQKRIVRRILDGEVCASQRPNRGS